MKKYNVLLLAMILLFSACKTKGDELSGIWYSTSEYGKMIVEFEPYKGKFYGYLLEYNDGSTTTKGKKTEDHIFIADLVYEGNQWKGGSVYIKPGSKATCGFSIVSNDSDNITVEYDCQEGKHTEVWTRKEIPQKEEKSIAQTKSMKKDRVNSTSTAANAIKKEKRTPVTKPKKTGSNKTTSTKSKQTPAKSSSNSVPKEYEGTKKASSFYVIGKSKTVDYSNTAAMSKVVEDLWTEAYEKDFSGKLKEITDQERMYLVYSDYEKPKGHMSLTLGYKVKSLANIPSGLAGKKVPANDFLNYPLSGNASDYEGEGWDQLYELMAYRNENSADFEVYSFDENYEVTDASIWIATK